MPAAVQAAKQPIARGLNLNMELQMGVVVGPQVPVSNHEHCSSLIIINAVPLPWHY